VTGKLIAPLLERDESNRADVLGAIAVMVLDRSATVLNVDVRVTERCPDGTTRQVTLSGPVLDPVPA
jgi:hypothetical protein